MTISNVIAARFSDINFQSADTELHEAAHKGDVGTLRRLITDDAALKEKIDRKNHLGCTALRLAATGGHVEAAEILLAAGARVDVSDVKGQTPLVVAVKGNHALCSRLLLEHGANAEGSLENIATPLYIATMHGFQNLVKLLLEFGANVTCQNVRVTRRPFSLDPLHIGVAYQQFGCVKLLLRAGANMDSYPPETTPLYNIAVKQKCGVQFMRLLHELGQKLYTTDSQRKYPWEYDMSGYSEEERDKVIDYFRKIREVPRNLKSSCRLCIVHHLRRSYRLTRLDSLGLPSTLLDFLSFSDL